jgi:protein-L-isoaspartate(D-aspartate) O-methyltransferase
MRRFIGLTVIGVLTISSLGALATGDEVYVVQKDLDLEMQRRRLEMVREVVEGAGVTHDRVLQSMRNTPRHEFVPPRYGKLAYFDMAVPIGDRQTISSPFIVAFMTQTLEPQLEDKVLEIGTGSGYQAAVLSPLVKNVYSIEIVESLGRRAAGTLRKLGYRNVTTKVGDGFLGWEEHAPFDKIIVTCSPEKVPQPLIDQLREGGRIVVPVGERYQQVLYVMRKENGKLIKEALRPTLFVPMTGEAEDRRDVRPDPNNPQAINGKFETPPLENGFIQGWYYQRQVTWDEDTAQQGNCVRIDNEELGRAGHILQGIPIDGRTVENVEFSVDVKTQDVRDKGIGNDYPTAAITFYDKDRKTISHVTMGRFVGTSDWKTVKRAIRVPPGAREGLLRLGLFGATGKIWFDNVEIGLLP